MHPQIRLQYLTGYPGLAYPHYRGGGGAGHPGGGTPGLPQQQHHQLHQKQDDQGETVLSANGLAGNISFLRNFRRNFKRPSSHGLACPIQNGTFFHQIIILVTC